MAATPPTIISRAQWGANPAVTPAATIPIPTSELWLHHSGGEQFGAAGMRLLQSFTLHRQDVKYVDLEYTFVVDHQTCQIFESRGPGHDTAATFDHNAVSHAICVMGNFETDPVSDQLVETLANLVAWGYEQGWWPLGITGGHRDASGNSTSCPGDHLEIQIPRINGRAHAIHAQLAPMKVKPMHSPPIVLPPIVADLARPQGGVWLASDDGAIFGFGGAPYPGGLNGKPYFAGRHVASLELPTKADVRAGYKLIVIATSGERYGVK